MRWLGVWFDRKLSFKTHVATLAAKAKRTAAGIRALGNTVRGPPRGYYNKLYRPAYNEFSAMGPRPGGQALTGYGEVNESRTGWTV